MARIMEIKHKGFSAVLSYGAKMQQFYITLTGDLAIYSRDYKSRVYACSQSSAEDEFKRIVNSHLESGVKSETLLVIQANEHDLFYHSDDFTRGGGREWGITIKYMVAVKMIVDGKEQYHDKKGARIWPDDNCVIIPYTQERETALSAIIDDMIALDGKISTVIHGKDFIRQLDGPKFQLLDHKK